MLAVQTRVLIGLKTVSKALPLSAADVRVARRTEFPKVTQLTQVGFSD
jgi:hypothetical protein